MKQEIKRLCLACSGGGVIYGWQGGSFSKRFCSLCNGEGRITVEEEAPKKTEESITASTNEIKVGESRGVLIAEPESTNEIKPKKPAKKASRKKLAKP